MRNRRASFEHILACAVLIVSSLAVLANDDGKSDLTPRFRSGLTVNGVWPVSGQRNAPDELSSAFGPRFLTSFPYDFHDGPDMRTLDIFGDPDTGIDIHAFYDGVVTAKGTFLTRSNDNASIVRINHIDLDDGDVFWTEYVHVDMDFFYWDQLDVGELVSTGQHILDSGDVGVPGSPHLHFNGLIDLSESENLLDHQLYAINPMRNDGLNYANNTAPRIDIVNYDVENSNRDARFIEFNVFTPKTELDLNKVIVSSSGDEVKIVFDGPVGTRTNADAFGHKNGDDSDGDEDGVINAKTSFFESDITIQITPFSLGTDDTEQKINFRYTNLPSYWTDINLMEVCAFDTQELSTCVQGDELGTSVEETSNRESNHNLESFVLRQNHPNPFNPSTTISFFLPKKATVSVVVHDQNGRLVRELVSKSLFDPGWQQIVWDGTNLSRELAASGTYLYRLDAVTLDKKDVFIQTRKLTLVR